MNGASRSLTFVESHANSFAISSVRRVSSWAARPGGRLDPQGSLSYVGPVLCFWDIQVVFNRQVLSVQVWLLWIIFLLLR